MDVAMNIPFLCVFVAFLLNYFTKIPLYAAMAKQKGGYDNHYPRDQQAGLTGYGKRVLGAHLNGFEVFPAFGISVILATLTGVDQYTLTILGITFVISRILYIYLYLADRDMLRSTTWFIGFICISANFVLAAF
jgi:uncharacterized MAPEG superfamily protein